MNAQDAAFAYSPCCSTSTHAGLRAVTCPESEVATADGDWQADDVWHALDRLVRLVPDGHTTWGPLDEWARVFHGDDLVALVCAGCPLGFYSADWDVAALDLPSDLTWIPMDPQWMLLGFG